MKKPEEIRKEMAEDNDFMGALEAVEKWPDHMYQFRPHGLMEALFLLGRIGDGEPLPSEMELRKACAVVYRDHIRLEGKFYYAQEAKEKDKHRRPPFPPRPPFKPFRKPPLPPIKRNRLLQG